MKVIVEELSAPGCHLCIEFERFWNSIKSEWPDVEYRKIDATSPEGQEIILNYMVFASPGIMINKELFSTGGFNKEKFIAKIKELVSK